MSSNTYLVTYVRNRRHTRKAKLLGLLGGQCVGCGTAERLQFDHVDPASRSFRITGCLDKNWDLLVAEAQKCQLLCHPCHIEKTRANGENPGGSNRKLPLVHGTMNAYGSYRCRCEPCREAKRVYRRSRMEECQRR